MADENQAREPEQEPEQGQEQIQEAEPAGEPAENQRKDKPVKKKKDDGGLLMPILYALLAAIGAFTLVMVIGIVITFLTQPDQPSGSPSTEPASGTSAPVQARQLPEGESPQNEVPFSFL